MTVVLVVSHTHWDREWYGSAVRFRQRLVPLVDELLDDPPGAGTSFLLDGQAVVLEDYLSLRPERSSEVANLLKTGALEAGPWYVLADELIPSGEALVRNLLAGRHVLRSLRASAPNVLYCPDSFGHPAALPALACGFGCGTVIVWRGYGSARWPKGDMAWWTSASGERALLVHLTKSGYELGSSLPPEHDAAVVRWATIRDELVQRNALGVALLLNGADHHARQARLSDALAALAAAARPEDIRPSSLSAFVADAETRAAVLGAALPAVSGELRDSYGFTWTLQGTLGTRAAQKRLNARAERLLVRDAEPWAALAARGGAPSRRAEVNAAWKSLLLCHPHDTLCGCSTDEVARAMDVRLSEAEGQGTGVRDAALADLLGHRAADARERRADWTPATIVRNPAARPRGGVALLRLARFLADVPVGPGSEPGSAAPPAGLKAPRVFALDGVDAVQVLSRRIENERTESPHRYPDNDLVAVADAIVWVPEIPAYGLRSFPDATRGRRAAVPHAAGVKRDVLSNGLVSVRTHADGRVEFTDMRSGRFVRDLIRLESLTDLGDTYTPSLRGPKFAPVFERRGWRVAQRGPVRAAIEGRWSMGERGRNGERIAVRVVLTLDAAARWLRIAVEGENGATNHRLRVRVATDVDVGATREVIADAAFGPVVRTPLEVSAEDARMETPPATAPLHRYVSLFAESHGATLFSDGLAEYESDGAGVAVTLVRSVGELSRNDIPERPGHAGWPLPTPEAQCLGSFGAGLALMLHGPRTPAAIDEIERAADDILLPLTGDTLRSALVVPPPFHGIELSGAGLAFSCAKESEDGEWMVLRCVNLLDEPVAGRWTLGTDVVEARVSRLDETPGTRLSTTGGEIQFTAPSRGIVTVLVR